MRILKIGDKVVLKVLREPYSSLYHNGATGVLIGGQYSNEPAGRLIFRFDSYDYSTADDGHVLIDTSTGLQVGPNPKIKVVLVVPDDCWMDVLGIIHKEET
jgi:hypothetical protein